jgi:hypothetical protein
VTPVRRHIFTFCWVLSLLLLFAVCLMWVRSHWVGDVVEWRRVTRDERIVWSWYLVLSSGDGGLGLSRDAEDYEAAYATLLDTGPRWSLDGWRRTSPTYPQPAFHAGAGKPTPMFAFRWGAAGNRRGGAVRRELIVPYWTPALLLALAPAVRLTRLLRDRRARHSAAFGRCHECGYDLRATPDRCPECGVATPSVSPTTPLASRE